MQLAQLKAVDRETNFRQVSFSENHLSLVISGVYELGPLVCCLQTFHCFFTSCLHFLSTDNIGDEMHHARSLKRKQGLGWHEGLVLLWLFENCFLDLWRLKILASGAKDTNENADRFESSPNVAKKKFCCCLHPRIIYRDHLPLLWISSTFEILGKLAFICLRQNEFATILIAYSSHFIPHHHTWSIVVVDLVVA